MVVSSFVSRVARPALVGWIVLGAAALGLGAGAGCGGNGGAAKPTTPADEARPARVPIDEADEADDDEPGDVQVEGLMGHLDRIDIQPVIERSWDDVQECYTQAVRKLRYVGGQMELSFRIARDGTVKHVHVARGTLGSWPVEKCVLVLARAMSFPRPKGGEAEFSFPIDFPSRGRTIAMDDGRASTEIPPKLSELSKCQDGSDGPMPGQIAVTLYIGPGGVVTSVGFSSDGKEPIPEAWADCAHAQATTWKLTDPRGSVWKATQTWEAH